MFRDDFRHWLVFSDRNSQPHIYMNELPVRMRLIDQVLPAVMKKLKIAENLRDISDRNRRDTTRTSVAWGDSRNSSQCPAYGSAACQRPTRSTRRRKRESLRTGS